jgi:hypothetical protein
MSAVIAGGSRARSLLGSTARLLVARGARHSIARSRGGLPGDNPPGSDFRSAITRNLARRSHTLRKFPKNLAGSVGFCRPYPPKSCRNRSHNRLDVAASAVGQASALRHDTRARGAAACAWHRTRAGVGCHHPRAPHRPAVLSLASGGSTARPLPRHQPRKPHQTSTPAAGSSAEANAEAVKGD